MSRPHPAALVEDCANRALGATLAAAGWRPVVVPHVGYGSDDFLRVLARVVRAPARDPRTSASATPTARRGWHTFLTVEVTGAEVTLAVPGSRREHLVRADRSGLVDVRIPNPGLGPGWHEVTVRAEGSAPRAVPVLVVAGTTGVGVVSDLDDTVIRTYLPRPLVAAYNALLVVETARRPVPGMADLLSAVRRRYDAAPVFYVSTGAWNAARMLGRFLERHDFPSGPMLLTDWGPTQTGWFRSGYEHKRTTLRRLAEDFPRVRWLLLGDDGQRDPEVYAEFAREYPARVLAIALRQLGIEEQVLSHGSIAGRPAQAPAGVPEVRGPDGYAILDQLRDLW